MASSAEEKVFKAAMALTDDERRRLCDRIEATLDEGSEEENMQAWYAEAERRSAQVAKGEVALVSGEEASRRVREALARHRRK